MKKTKEKTWTAWAGFVNGNVAEWPATDAYEVPAVQLEIFTTRKAARARFVRVEKVEIKVITKESTQ